MAKVEPKPRATAAEEARPLYVGGRWADETPTFDVVNPYTGDRVAQVHKAERATVEEAIARAVESFAETRRLPTYERGEILLGISRRIAERAEEFARTIALEAGKPIRDARAEVARAVSTFRIASEEARRFGGELLPLDITPAAVRRVGLTRRFPRGPVAAISPFNFPLNLACHKVAPAIAVGCPVVLKPASKVPLTALLLAEVVAESGWPAGAFSVLPADRQVGDLLVTDPRFAVLSFTGSPAVGWDMKARAGAKKKVVLELGGNAGMIVDETADLEHAARRGAVGAFSYAGQVCISVQRIFVLSRVRDRFLDAFLRQVASLRLGDPLDESTDVGPMIDDESAARTREWVEEAVAAGATLLAGGRPDPDRPRMFPPTVLADVPRGLRIECEEAFAPVVLVERVDTFEEALRRVNDSRFGLQAGVFTNDQRHVWQAFETLEVGGVIVNDAPSFRVDSMPYGGVKDSGFGREGLRYAMEDMTEIRVLVLDRPG